MPHSRPSGNWFRVNGHEIHLYLNQVIFVLFANFGEDRPTERRTAKPLENTFATERLKRCWRSNAAALRAGSALSPIRYKGR